jgi:8-oxo-dGTP pyrophosphatase MutT (NUDIX family)
MALSEYIQSLRARAGPDLLLLPGVCALIFNPAGEILLQRRSDNGRWSLIGGMMEPGEHPADALVREVREETGLTVSPERITGVYLTRIVTYPDGNAAQYVITVFRCRPISGTPHVADDESLEVRYFPLSALPELSSDHRQRIEYALTRQDPFFQPPTHGAGT